MAGVDYYSTNEALNLYVEGIPTGEGAMTIPSINNLFRRMAASIRELRNLSYCKDRNVTIQASGGLAPASPSEGDLWIEY